MLIIALIVLGVVVVAATANKSIGGSSPDVLNNVSGFEASISGSAKAIKTDLPKIVMPVKSPLSEFIVRKDVPSLPETKPAMFWSTAPKPVKPISPLEPEPAEVVAAAPVGGKLPVVSAPPAIDKRTSWFERSVSARREPASTDAVKVEKLSYTQKLMRDMLAAPSARERLRQDDLYVRHKMI